MRCRSSITASRFADGCVAPAALAAILSGMALCSGCGRQPAPPLSRPPTAAGQNSGPPAVVPDSTAGHDELIVSAAPPQAVPAPASSPPEQNSETEPVFRPDDWRMRPDEDRAKSLGIHRYESTRLLLYTDIDSEVARPLPPLMDEAYLALVDYFGPLPPARNGAEYQMTGYIMSDADRFREAGMLPQEASNLLVHGLHRGSEFWMHSQEYDYYRRHLMIHEGTHCFMTVLNGPRPSAWYMEGMAEYFGTHRVAVDGRTEFGVMPDSPTIFLGFGRVEMLRDEVAAGKFRSISDMLALSANDYIASRREPYAWSWAFCKFLETHPRYQSRFRQLIGFCNDRAFARQARELLSADDECLAVEWELFIRNLEYGFDIARAVIDFQSGSPLPAGNSATIELQADAGWQSSGVQVDAGATYRLAAAGEVTVGLEPKPWISQPQGVSIHYVGGRPLGRVVAAIQSASPPGPNGEGALWHVIDVGRDAELNPAVSGTLYLRVNDDWNSLADNAGSYAVEIGRQ